MTRSAGYVGLICSKLKRREMFAKLRERGVDEAALGRVEAPLGLAIGAESPAEIAVSILGSIIKHHKGHSEATHAKTDEDDETVQPIRAQG